MHHSSAECRPPFCASAKQPTICLVFLFFFFQMVETFLFVMVLYCLNNVDLAVHVPQHQHTSQIVFQLTEF
jgi:hypothetical protein